MACSPTDDMHIENLAGENSVCESNEEDRKSLRDKKTRRATFEKAFASNLSQTVKRRKIRKSAWIAKRSCRKLQGGEIAEDSSGQLDAVAPERLRKDSPSVSGEIETDDSNLDLDEQQPREGALQNLSSSRGACSFKQSVTEGVTEVVITVEVLLLSEDTYLQSPQFTFRADAIILKISDVHPDSTVIEWPMNEIDSFGSYTCPQAGYMVLELGLTDYGAETLKKKLLETPSFDRDDLLNCTVYCLKAKISDVDWPEQKRQIFSLSDGYRSVWRPLSVFTEQVSECVGGFQFLGTVEQVSEGVEEFQCLGTEILDTDGCGREDLDNLREDDGSTDLAEEGRYEDKMYGWFDIVYPKGDHDAVTVTQNDYLLLYPEQFISDTIIDFYIKHIQSTLSEHQKGRLYFFNSFFFRKLTEIDKCGPEKPKSAFERVKRWTAKVNIFEKDYLFIPIMHSAHWSLIVVCHPGYITAGGQETSSSKAPVILHFDSLEGCHRDLEEPIQNYLMEAWIQKFGVPEDLENLSSNIISQMEFITAPVPQQTNYCDCGLFLLHYVELFIRDVIPEDCTESVTSEWFNPADASGKRVDIRELVLELRSKELIERGVAFESFSLEDHMASSTVHNGMVLVNRALVLQELLAMENDSVSTLNGSERINVIYDNYAEQLSGTNYSGPLHCGNNMFQSTLDANDPPQYQSSVAEADLYSSTSLGGLVPVCQDHQNLYGSELQNSVGPYKQLLMFFHSNSLMEGKESVDNVREEDFSNNSVPLPLNPVCVDINPDSPIVSVHASRESGHVCHLSECCHNNLQKIEDDSPNKLPFLPLLGLQSNGIQNASEEMTTKEMQFESTVNRLNESCTSSEHVDSMRGHGVENIEPCKFTTDRGIENAGSILDMGKYESYLTAFQGSTIKHSQPMPCSSPLSLNKDIDEQSKDQISADTKIGEVPLHNESDEYNAVDSKKILTTHRDLCAHEAFMPMLPTVPNLNNSRYKQSGGQCYTLVGIEPVKMVRTVNVRKQSHRKKVLKRFVTRSAAKRLRSATKRLREKQQMMSFQQRRRKVCRSK